LSKGNLGVSSGQRKAADDTREGAPQCTSVVLRPYQVEAIDRTRQAYRDGALAPLLVLPTGGGKTVVFSAIAASAVARGRRVLVLCHRRELIRQASQKLAAAGVPHGIIAPGHEPTDDMVQVASVQTLARRLGDPLYATFDLIVLDEAHHAVAGQWAAIVAAYPNAKLLGVTATPERLDGKGLGREAGGTFDWMVEGPSVSELTEAGYLVRARVFAPAVAPDLSDVAVRAGDYDAGDLAKVMGSRALIGDTEAEYRRRAAGLPAVAFCVSVEHAKTVASEFRAAGWRAVAVSGGMSMAERDAALNGLATGEVQVLCTCDLISEGLDVPAIGAAILLRPTKSLGLHVQQIGRGLRPAPGKDHLVVLDHAGNTQRHGLPDMPHAWSLLGRGKRSGRAPVRACPECGAVCRVAALACDECGHQFERQSAELQTLAGELQEVTTAEKAAQQAERFRLLPLRRLLEEAQSESDLRAIAAARGYRPGWVWHTMQSRAAAQSGENPAA
jgi:superfamily II DNA or RNA helicase